MKSKIETSNSKDNLFQEKVSSPGKYVDKVSSPGNTAEGFIPAGMTHAIIGRAFPKMARFAFLLFIIWMSKTQTACGQSTDTQQSSPQPADLFKKFIEHPPTIQDIFFENRAPERHPSFYHIKWQSQAEYMAFNRGTNGAALEEATNLVDYENIYSRYGNVYWQKVGHDLYTWTNDNTAAFMTNSMTYTHDSMGLMYLRQVINFGFGMAPVGSIHWINDTFSSTNTTAGYWYKGKLSRDESGKAEHLRVSHGKIGHHEDKGELQCDYFYDQPLSLEYLPDRIEWLSIGDDGKKEFSQTYVIHSITISGKPLPEEAFSLKPLLGTTNITVAVSFTNGYFVFAPKNGNVPTVVRDNLSATLRQPKYQRMYFMVAIFLFMLPFLMLLFSKFGKQIKETTTNKS